MHDYFKILGKGNEPKSLSSLEVFNIKCKYWRGLSAQAIPQGFMHLIMNVPAALSASHHHDFSPVVKETTTYSLPVLISISTALK